MCVEHGSNSGLKVIAGLHNRFEDSDPAVQKSEILQVKNQEEWHEPNRHSNDISLLKLATKLIFNENVAPSCAPREVDYAGDTVTISGWGTTYSGGYVTEELRYTYVIVQTNAKCSESYPDRIDETMVCAAAPGRDTCKGDSGGPMAYNNNGRFEVMGLTSWGRGCALEGFAGVYSRVSAQLKWIADNAK
ncbi:DgyrCDS14149 [Dimorphilus gyrociliatus]|uniref:DgyrCDS14143 n=1 Tax=Dimorphilus gyrociliatus TaxID=2664684 RepID=A0A7I8WCZ8_9ANNE|nr:DgyrCDS14143 [Dimorphilus gyrociliatus]CAD5125967.1 DgyrCDS14149 [Dimorphilus gyrociliatus]